MVRKQRRVVKGIDNMTATTVEQVKEDIMNIYEERTSKKKIDDTHIRKTYLIRRDLAKKLDRVSKGKHGFKTLMVNKALESILRDFD